jgi:hypothetical protein
MPFVRSRDLPEESTRSLRRGISVATVAFIAAVFGVSFASAAPLEEAAHAVESVTATPAPSLPSAPPSATPPAPVGTPNGTPSRPQVPVDHASVEVPTGETSTSAPASHHSSTPPHRTPKVSSPRAELPLLHRATGSAQESPGRVTSSLTIGATPGAAAPVRDDANVDSDSPRDPPSVESARPALLPRWFAHVWPAIALGNTGTLVALLARGESASLLPSLTPRSASNAVRLLSGLMSVTGDSDSSALSKQSVTPIGSPLPSPVASVPASGGMSLFLTITTSLLALVGLIALGRLTVGEEFFSFLRWPHRHLRQ